MSEDEGTNSSTQGVPSEDRSDDGETEDVESAPTGASESDAGDGDRDPDPDAGDGNSSDESRSESAAETGDARRRNSDVQQILDQVTEYDDELAQKVNAIVERARELKGTATHQREELEDLSERVEEQAETIGDLQAELEAREEEIEEYEEEVEDLKSRLKRKQADFQNYKKRAKKRQEQIKDRATEDLVERLIGVRDNLKRALEEEEGDVESLREGVDMTLREFDRILEDENVSEIDPDPGSEADPQRHEVMMQVDSAQPEGTIAEVYTPGYEMGDKVIQNAQVTVSNGELDDPAETDTDEDDEAGASDSEGSTGESQDDGDDADAAGDDAETDDAEAAGDAETDDEAIELGGEVTDDE